MFDLNDNISLQNKPVKFLDFKNKNYEFFYLLPD